MTDRKNQLNDPVRQSRLMTAFAVICVFVICIYAVYFNALGPDASTVMNFFGIDNSQHGFILTVQAVGTLAVALFMTMFGEMFNKISSALLGTVLISSAALLIGSIPLYISQGEGYPQMLSFAAVGGIGMTLINININGAVTDIFPEKKKTIMPLMHAFYGAACMIIPVIVSATTDDSVPESFANPYIIIGVFGVCVLAVFAVLGKRVKPFTPYADMSESVERTKKNPFEIYSSPLAWILLAASYLYFFFQIGMVNWFPTFSIRDLGIDYKISAFFNTAFFGGQLVMRFLLALLLRKLSAEKCFTLFGLIGAASIFMSMFMNDAYAVMIMLIIGGFFQGGNATLLIIISTSVFPKRSASASALVDITIGLSSLTGPLIIGMIADANGGSLRSSIILMIASLIASTLVMLVFSRKKRRTDSF